MQTQFASIALSVETDFKMSKFVCGYCRSKENQLVCKICLRVLPARAFSMEMKHRETTGATPQMHGLPLATMQQHERLPSGAFVPDPAEKLFRILLRGPAGHLQSELESAVSFARVQQPRGEVRRH